MENQKEGSTGALPFVSLQYNICKAKGNENKRQNSNHPLHKSQHFTKLSGGEKTNKSFIILVRVDKKASKLLQGGMSNYPEMYSCFH